MDYGLKTAKTTTYTTNHEALNLETDTLYHYRIWAWDAAGNVSVSEDQVRTTYHHI